MFKAIVADDNEIHLNQICSIIEWSEYGVEIVGKFENGKDVLESIDVLNPDFIITDIFMPDIDGIELAEIVKRRYPQIKIVLVSSSDDFEMAKSAIDLNLSGYLLKPINKENIEAAVIKIVDEMKKENEVKKELAVSKELANKSKELFKEQFFRELINGNIQDDSKVERIKFLDLENLFKNKLAVLTLKVIDYNNFYSKESTSKIYLLSCIISNTLGKKPEKINAIYPIQLTPMDFAVVVFFEQSEEKNCLLTVTDYAVDIYNELSEEYNINLTIGISMVGDELNSINEMYRQANQALENRFMAQNTPIFYYKDSTNEGVNLLESNANFSVLYNKVKLMIFSEDYSDIKLFIGYYLDEKKVKSLSGKEYSKSFVIFVISILNIILIEEKNTINDVFGEKMEIWKKLSEFESILDINQWLYNVIIAVKQHINGNITSNEPFVSKIKEFIHLHYKEDISVNDIANHVYFSVRQANYAFKKETGVTIFDYFVEYRIDMAKKLLLTTKLKVHEVAESIGYSNISHFRLMFYKQTGMMPMDYKKKML